ncbi:hypothetical protein BGZ97_006583 [Linnemannia gamsii]|jgi:hypothetical protein|uniref:Uncharacterized protein n=1 Tax=Linnemannia gamsii TaxID=64522 RepID=A0A9P6UQN8_9FUNG|nr:hypothetical protein BGZ97_006583 [Linnemannia gamsii]
MLDSSIIQVLLVIGFPYIIKAVRSFFAKAPPPSPLQRLNNKQNPTVKTQPPSKWNQFMYLLLTAATVFHLAQLTFYNHPNVFKTLSLPADCPNFILHQSWKERSAADPTFLTRFPDSMREQFKAMESRLIYILYGQDAFVNCDHCSERNDYLMYLFPNAIASYAGMAILLGMATTQTSHLNRQRTWGSAGLVVLALFEYSVLHSSSEAVNLSALVKQEKVLVGARGAYAVRHGSLALMAMTLMGLIYRSGRSTGPRSEVEILNDLCQAQEAMIQRHRALQLARVASLRDPLLRKQFVEYWKRREVEHGLLLSDTEYKEARDLALSRIDVETLTQEANQYIEAVIQAGERVADDTAATSAHASSSTSGTSAKGEGLTKLGQEMAP